MILNVDSKQGSCVGEGLEGEAQKFEYGTPDCHTYLSWSQATKRQATNKLAKSR